MFDPAKACIIWLRAWAFSIFAGVTPAAVLPEEILPELWEGSWLLASEVLSLEDSNDWKKFSRACCVFVLEVVQRGPDVVPSRWSVLFPNGVPLQSSDLFTAEDNHGVFRLLKPELPEDETDGLVELGRPSWLGFFNTCSCFLGSAAFWNALALVGAGVLSGLFRVLLSPEIWTLSGCWWLVQMNVPGSGPAL